MSRPGSADGDERLADWLDGRMSARERERFEAEMRVSKPLREKAEAYARTAKAVKEAFSVDAPSVDVADAVLARLTGRGGPAGTGAKDSDSHSSPSLSPAESAGRVLPFPRTVPSAWIWSGLVACAIVTLVLLLERWQPAATEARDAQAPAPEDPGPTAVYHLTPIGGTPADDGDAQDGRVPLREQDKLQPQQQAADPGFVSAPSPEPFAPGSELRGNGASKDSIALRRLGDPRAAAAAESNAVGEPPPVPGAAKKSVDGRIAAGTQDAEPRTGAPSDQVPAESGAAASDGVQGGEVQRDEGALAFGFSARGAPPRTTVPTIRLRARSPSPETGRPQTPVRETEGTAQEKEQVEAKDKAARPESATRDQSAGPDGALVGAVELDRALGNVQVFRLPSVPGEARDEPKSRRANEREDASGTWSAGTPQAWLIEGPAEDVQAFLKTLSEAGRARGYEVVNGEVTIADLLAADPSLPATPGARFVPRNSRAGAGAGGEGARDLGAPSSGPGGGAGLVGGGGSSGPSSPGPNGPGPGSAGSRPGAARGARPEAPGSGGAEQAKVPRPPGGAVLVMPVRILVVIEPTK